MSLSTPASVNMYEEFASYGMGQLRDYLSVRGLQCAGNKKQLVSRCYVAWENKVELRLCEKERQLQIQEEYQNKLRSTGIEDPRSINEQNWTDNITMWPKVDLGKIFAFILSKKEHGFEFVGQYKTHKAYSYYMSGFVDTIKTTLSNDIKIVKSKVTPSQSIRNEPHEVWIAFDNGNTCDIISCWCSCIAGMAETCNHCIAVLYKLEYANTMGYIEPSCTSVPCSWNSSTKKIQQCRLSDMNIRQDNRSKVADSSLEDRLQISLDSQEFRLNFDPRREEQQVVSPTDLQRLYGSLYAVQPSAVLFKGLPKAAPSVQLPKPLPVYSEQYLADGKDRHEFMKSLSPTHEEANLIEESTRGQGNCIEWKQQRCGRLTASIHHEISTKMNTIVKSKTPVKTSPLVEKILGNQPNLDHISAVKYGKENENMARIFFQQILSSGHRNVKICHCGLFVKFDRPYIAASPDGIVSCDCCTKAILEIKCPFALANENVNVAWMRTDFLECVHGKIGLRKSHKYYTQVQSQMAVTGLTSAYFFVWSPKGFLVNKIEFDPTFWMSLQEQLVNFFTSYMLPYLLKERGLSFCPSCDKVCLQEVEIKDTDENSILCDCCNLWYHWKCASIKKNTENEWVCQSCLLTVLDL